MTTAAGPRGFRARGVLHRYFVPALVATGRLVPWRTWSGSPTITPASLCRWTRPSAAGASPWSSSVLRSPLPLMITGLAGGVGDGPAQCTCSIRRRRVGTHRDRFQPRQWSPRRARLSTYKILEFAFGRWGAKIVSGVLALNACSAGMASPRNCSAGHLSGACGGHLRNRLFRSSWQPSSAVP